VTLGSPGEDRYGQGTMRVTCEQCRVEYELSDDRVPPGGAQVQCTACHHVFVARNPGLLDTIVLNRTERELLVSLLADLELLRQAPDLQYLGGDEPTVLSVTTKERVGLREIANVRQVPGESPRRWFTSNDLDLILWLGPGGQPHGFQLCYGKREGNERAVTWWPARGLTHSTVDEGRREPHKVKGTPTLASGGEYDAAGVLARFLATKGQLAPEFVDFVAQRLAPGSA
jgi:predicted Zn finger-like uncharacterized protein